MSNVQSAIDEFKKLAALATKNPEGEEARNAAIAALKVLDENKLVVTSEEHLEKTTRAVEGAKQALEAAKKAQSDAQGKLILGALGGFMAAKVLKL